MADDSGWQAQVRSIRSGDDREVLAFCRRYGPTLTTLADRHLAPRLRRRLDPEDVVQSVFRTFFRRASDGQFELADADGLWALLRAITMAKVAGQARAASRARRDVARDGPLAADGSDGASDAPTAEEEAIFIETIDRLFGGADEEQRAIMTLRLKGLTHEQVADAVGCSERTVRRILAGLRTRLEHDSAAGA